MKYIVGNWKMNMTLESITKWVADFNVDKTDATLEVIVAPSFLHIPLISKQNISIAAQDISEFEKGAHTGDVGINQLKDFCRYCIVGHSERNEKRDLVYKKRDLCLANGITPIVCFVSSTELLASYVEGALLAWEDPQNISKDGVYRAAPFEKVEQTFEEFEALLPKVKIIYGGSVNRENIANLVKIQKLGGVLPGQASTDPLHFMDIIKAFENV